MAQNDNNNGKQRRGFAAMDQERQREIAAEGGRSAHEMGRAHEWDSREAREAGRKGGLARGRNQNSEGGEGGDMGNR